MSGFLGKCTLLGLNSCPLDCIASVSLTEPPLQPPLSLIKPVSSVWSGSLCSHLYLGSEALGGSCFPFCFCNNIKSSEFPKTQSTNWHPNKPQLSLDPIYFWVLPKESVTVLMTRSLLVTRPGFYLDGYHCFSGTSRRTLGLENTKKSLYYKLHLPSETCALWMVDKCIATELHPQS